MTRLHQLRGFSNTVIVVAALAAPSLAWAGEIVVGAKQIATDDSGKITKDSRQQKVDTLENVPGQDSWEIHVWAEITKGAMGPLYVEFWHNFQGKELKVPWMYEHAGYQGEKYVNLDFELEGDHGFNKDTTYRIRMIQVDEKRRDIVVAQGAKVKLFKPDRPEDKKKDEKKEEEDEEDEESNAQDVADTLAGGDEAEGDSGPPPVDGPGRKRGCAIGPESELGLVVLAALWAAGLRRRRA